jgi:hypothetical protein
VTVLAAEEAGTAATAARAGSSTRTALGSTQAQRTAELQRRRKAAAAGSKRPAKGSPAPASLGGGQPAPAGDQGPAEQLLPARGLAKEGLQNAVPGSRLAAKVGGAVVNSQAAQTGGGFLLGLGAWALGLAYLRGGPAEVRRLIAAKFLNKVS